MKKMMKSYEAPKAEMFEMQMPTVLMSSGANGTNVTIEDPTETEP